MSSESKCPGCGEPLTTSGHVFWPFAFIYFAAIGFPFNVAPVCTACASRFNTVGWSIIAVVAFLGLFSWLLLSLSP